MRYAIFQVNIVNLPQKNTIARKLPANCLTIAVTIAELLFSGCWLVSKLQLRSMKCYSVTRAFQRKK